MPTTEINKTLALAKQNLLNGTIYHTFHILDKIFQQNPDIRAKSDYENLKATFNYMLQYFAKDTPDPQREIIYAQIKKDLLSIIQEVIEHFKSIEETDPRNIYYFYYKKADFVSLMKNFDNDNSVFHMIFLYIWLTNHFDDDMKLGIKEFVSNDKIDFMYKSAIVSAITLSLVRFLDENKFDVLFDTYHKQYGECSLRAIVGIILGLIIHEDFISLYPKIITNLSFLHEVPDNEKNIELILFQLIKSRETEQIIQEFEKEILPEMMKMQGKLKNIDFEELSENLMDEENPGWENFFDKNPDFMERMQNFTKRQFDGSDIFSATLGNLKSFPFFNKISNWFLPFSPTNSEILTKLKEAIKPELAEKFLTVFENASYFCNSDKYSFCLYIPSINQMMRETTVNLLMAEIESAEEMLKEEHLNNLFRKNRDIIIRYIQDLYRFFNFNNNFRGYTNIFKLNLNFTNTELLNNFENKEKIIQDCAELLFSIKQYSDAANSFETTLKMGINSSDLYEKAGFCYQKMGNFSKALEMYKKAELFDHNKSWLYNKIAFSYYKTSQYENALEYYKKLETEKPDDINIQTFIGKCFAEMNNFEAALKQFFKIDFYKPNDTKTMRYIAYCSFNLGKYEQAKKYSQKCIESKADKFDFFILGNCYWILKEKTEAILYYITAMSDYKVFDEFLTDFIYYKQNLLKNEISETEINLMIDYLEMKFINK